MLRIRTEWKCLFVKLCTMFVVAICMLFTQECMTVYGTETEETEETAKTIEVTIYVNYFSEYGCQIDYISKTVESGTTYQNVMDDLKQSGELGKIKKHHPELKFEGWKCSKDLNTVITYDNSYYYAWDDRYIHSISVEAEYDKIPLDVTYSYFSKYRKMEYEDVLFVDKGTTVGDLVNMKFESPAIVHTDKLGKLIGWHSYDGYDEKVSMGYYPLCAEYEKQGIEMDVSYYNKAGAEISFRDIYVIPKGTTYDGLSNVIEPELAELEHMLEEYVLLHNSSQILVS